MSSRFRSESINLYTGENIKQALFDKIHQTILNMVNQLPESNILDSNEIELADSLISEHIINFPVFNFDGITVEDREEYIPAEQFPNMLFSVVPGQRYKKNVYVFHIPYSGNIEILKYRPVSSYTYGGGSTAMKIEGNEALLEIVDFYGQAEKVNIELESEKRGIMTNYSHLQQDCNNFNGKLQGVVVGMIQDRKAGITKKKSVLTELGIPLHKKADTSETFSIPKPKLREPIQMSSNASQSSSNPPEPALSDDNYQQILKIISDVGQNLERMPSIYRDRGEEDLRDFILFVLDPNFQLGSASGETFNKTGKTDIMLRYDSSVVFIAECKFWKGEKGFLATIDQLLGYLTWRNSKASIIIFYDKKNLSDVLGKIEAATPEHSNYIEKKDKTSETWFNYIFHVNGDGNRRIDLSVLVFNLPENEG